MNFFDFSFSTLGDPIRDLSAFDCGRKEINKFFQKDALDYQNELFSKTYLLSPRNDLDKVAAAFTVANTCLFTRMLPNSRKKKIGYEVRHSKGSINYPAILLGQLGVDAHFAGHRLGAQIIEFIAQWFSSQENKSGCRYLIVEAYNEDRLLSFYAKCGLKPVFNDIEQERIYRHLDDDKPLETRLLYRDLILFRRKSIRN
ncbi:N-acetyltransferase [Fibrobacter sp.]|uniref:N-acetyltransferase n=1 Tax=Fibrobacter sp. TaxID=35828 RepID=UPI0025FC82AE|nr:N-acetyltransferase [Fibrobacter sp.]MDD5942438.1 N-acetyltransferase [Fibrobacter sp.]